MKREFIFTGDNHPKTKEYLHLDFDAKVSFTEFEEGHEEEKALLQFPISFDTKNPDDVEFISMMFNLYHADFWLEDNKETFEAIDIVRVATLSGLCCFFRDEDRIKEISKILKGTVIKTYEINILADDLQKLEEYDDIISCATHYILHYKDSAEGNWRHKQNKDILNFNRSDFDQGTNVFFMTLDEFGYKVDVEEDNYLLYVIYCVLFLKLDLYLTYIHSKSGFRITVVDEKQLHLHMINGSYVLNLSTIILNIYKGINIEGLENYSSLSKIIEDQSWKKLFQDLKNDSQYKNKVTFTIDTRDNKPLFMSSKWKEEDMNRYKEIEEMIGENGSIEKKMNHGKWSSIAIKKQYLYGNKAR